MHAQLKALAAAIVLDNGDPPDTDYQRGYMAASEEIAKRIKAIIGDMQDGRGCLSGITQPGDGT